MKAKILLLLSLSLGLGCGLRLSRQPNIQQYHYQVVFNKLAAQQQGFYEVTIPHLAGKTLKSIILSASRPTNYAILIDPVWSAINYAPLDSTQKMEFALEIPDQLKVRVLRYPVRRKHYNMSPLDFLESGQFSLPVNAVRVDTTVSDSLQFSITIRY